jgi:hypothetical protein
VHVWNFIGAKQEHVEERKGDGHETQAECHGSDDDHRDQGSALESTNCVENVPDRVVE